ncbi:MFS transporter [Cupriavidus sp. 2MCAB6]|uniref:MFS transporter n=1 Tax=Cupriavidus sp. 2MCAB6 TaxID=3232981 RepID=UPI003F8FB921
MNTPTSVPAGDSTAGENPNASCTQKIVVAIHGIGSQLRSDTVRSVASQFGARYAPALPVMPLGYFDIAGVGQIDVRQLDLPERNGGASTAANDLHALYSSLSFGEVYWADIPRKVVKEEDKLEEGKAWGLSIVSRVQAAYMRDVRQGKLEPADFTLVAGVVDEMVETVAVMQNLLFVAEKAGFFKFDLGPVLRDYVGDVQLVADFQYQREVIICRFHNVMQQIVARGKERTGNLPELYIVAHSEGTVISFLGILEALSAVSRRNPDDNDHAVGTTWIGCLRGFMTIGSPIHKHILLWPKLWENMQIKCHRQNKGVLLERQDGTTLELPQPIKWRNYYDFGDPVGFELDTAREYMKLKDCEAFEFDESHDYGFSRYWLPGKAHTDYWTDKEVFGHFIDNVVLGKDVKGPKSRPLRSFVSTGVPYLLSFSLHLLAVFVLYKALAPVSKPETPQPVSEFLTRSVFALACLLMGATAAARLPRLVKAKGKRTSAWLRWRLLSLGMFALGAAICWLFLPTDVAQFLSPPSAHIIGWIVSPSDGARKLAFIAAGACIAVSGWLVPRRPRVGRRLLVLIGALLVGAIVTVRMWDAADQPFWPVVLAGALFLYAWWLAILIFDLAFVWHRYIRHSVALGTLRAWRERKADAEPLPLMQGGLRAGNTRPQPE